MSSGDRTLELLERWHAGERTALTELVERDREWILAHVRRRRGPALQRDADTVDNFQDLMLEVLQYSPRFVVANRAQFRRLVARMVDNLLADRARWLARRRPADGDIASWSSESRLCLDPALHVSDAPSAQAARAEEVDWLRLGMQFLDSEGRRIVYEHKLLGRSYVEIAEELDLQPNAARMRCNRALLRLAGILRRLQNGGLDELLAEQDD